MPKYVERLWTPAAGARGRRNRTAFRFRAYVPDPISDLSPPTGPVATELAEAEDTIRRFTGAVHLRGVDTLARQLLRSESVASSRIEGLRVSHRKLAEAAFDPALANQTAREVLANLRAMSTAISRAADSAAIDTTFLVDIHRVLLPTARDAWHAGRLREDQNWIGRGETPRNAEFVPPPPELVEGLLKDLDRFIARDGVPVLWQAAIAHAQFETIHPFADGNGRTGRCLIHAILKRRQLVDETVPPISVALAGAQGDYVAGLTAFRSGDQDAWLSTFAAATTLACEAAVTFSQWVEAEQARWRQVLHPRAGSSLAQLIEVLPAHPVLSIDSAAAACGVSRRAVGSAVETLESAGIVKQVSRGGRNRIWICPELFHLLDEFESSMPAGPESIKRGPRPPTRIRPLPEITARQSDVLNLLHDGIDTLSGLSGQLPDYTEREIRKTLEQLRDLKLATVTGRTRGARWSATDHGRAVLSREARATGR